MARAPFILARNNREASAFAREHLGLDRGKYRVVMSPSTLSSVRGVDLYLVPGWEKRHDRFAMKGALRYARLNQIEVQPDQNPAAVPDDLDPPGVQLSLVTNLEASAFVEQTQDAPDRVDLMQAIADENDQHELDDPLPLAPGSVDAPALVAAVGPQVIEKVNEVKRRRRKCPDCGQLHFKDEPCHGG